MTQEIPVIINTVKESVTVHINGKQYTAQRSTHDTYDKILERIKDKDYDGIENLFDIRQHIKNTTDGQVEIRDSSLFYKGFELNSYLANKIISMHDQGYPVSNLIRFLENLMENPSRTSVEELYLFLEYGDMPITEDGCFLAYKKVRENYTDIHSGTFNNSIGKVVQVERNTVDNRRYNTCSYGLHFCSKEYLGSFGSSHNNRVVILKINPKDVVSIPSDYNNTKGRCCRYEVIGEWEGYQDYKTSTAFDRSYYSNDDLRNDYGYEYGEWKDDYEEDYEEEEMSYDSDDNPVERIDYYRGYTVVRFYDGTMRVYNDTSESDRQDLEELDYIVNNQDEPVEHVHH